MDGRTVDGPTIPSGPDGRPSWTVAPHGRTPNIVKSHNSLKTYRTCLIPRRPSERQSRRFRHPRQRFLELRKKSPQAETATSYKTRVRSQLEALRHVAREDISMGLRINTNISSLNAQHSLARATESLSSSFRRLSTGSRIAVAADDAAGLAISERLRARIRSTDQAARNAQDGISLVQTAEGALQEINSVLVRMRELGIQSANGTTSLADKQTLDQEFQALYDEVGRISTATSFNTIKLLDGSTPSLTLHVGADTVAGIDTLNVTLTAVGQSNLTLTGLDITSASNAKLSIDAIDLAIDAVSQSRGDLGAIQNRLTGLIFTLQVASENLSAAESRIRDVDVASETAALTKHTILQQAAISVLAQANVQPQSALSLLQQ